MKPSPEYAVREFHDTFSLPIEGEPNLGSEELRQLRLTLIEEELAELELALAEEDIAAVADALGDLVYVVYGAALSFGIPLDAVVAEIHRSNMTKLWDTDDLLALQKGFLAHMVSTPEGRRWIVTRADGKVIKPPSYSPPRLKEVLALADWWNKVWPGGVL